MRRFLQTTLIILPAILLLATAINAQLCGNEQKWRYRLVPYIWFTGINGNVTVRGESANVNASFLDLAKNMDFGFMVHFEAQKDKWGYFIDPIYTKLSADGTVEDTSGSINLKQWIVDFGGTRRLWNKPQSVNGKNASIDLIFGGRYWSLSSDLNVNDVGAFSGDQSWVDPIIGARYVADISRLWEASTKFDIGGFGVGSDFTWNLVLLLGYHTSENGQLLFGYRFLGVDRESGSGDNFFKYNVTYSGPIVGYNFAF